MTVRILTMSKRTYELCRQLPSGAELQCYWLFVTVGDATSSVGKIVRYKRAWEATSWSRGRRTFPTLRAAVAWLKRSTLAAPTTRAME